MEHSKIKSKESKRRQQNNPQITSLPSELESMGAKLVYLHLSSTSGGTVHELRNSLNIPTISIYPILNSLQEDDLIRRIDGRYVCTSAL